METFNKLIELIAKIDTSLSSVNFRVVKKKNNGPTIITFNVVPIVHYRNIELPSVCITRSLGNFEKELNEIIRKVEDIVERTNKIHFHVEELRKADAFWKDIA